MLGMVLFAILGYMASVRIYDWIKGTVLLTNRDLDWLKNKGFKIREMNYPNKLKDLKDIKFDIEILEFEEEPDFYTKTA